MSITFRLGLIPFCKAKTRAAAIAEAGSTSCGQRAVQVSHPRHNQMAWLLNTESARPRRMLCMTWAGLRSILSASGQPEEHLLHWKHRLTFCPLRAWISSRKAMNIPFKTTKDEQSMLAAHLSVFRRLRPDN